MAITNFEVDTPAGLSKYENTDLANTAVGVKSSSTAIHYIEIDNPNGAAVYVRLYNVVVGSTTVGTTTTDTVILVPASTVLKIPFPLALTFGTALTVACTLNKIENDTTDPGASAVILRILYV